MAGTAPVLEIGEPFEGRGSEASAMRGARRRGGKVIQLGGEDFGEVGPEVGQVACSRAAIRPSRAA